MIPRTSSRTSRAAGTMPPLAEDTRTGIGPLDAELLIVAMDPKEAQASLGAVFEENGIVFDPSLAGQGRIVGRITTVMQPLAAKPLPLPSEVQTCSDLLCAELQTMHQLRLVLTLGVSAHIVLLGACGVPLSRLDFRPGEITRLPDGLLLADAYHFPKRPLPADILSQRRTTIAALAPKIREALRGGAPLGSE